MRVLAAITEPSAARRILESMRLPPRAPPLTPPPTLASEPDPFSDSAAPDDFDQSAPDDWEGA
jgi:hypothetical protein